MPPSEALGGILGHLGLAQVSIDGGDALGVLSLAGDDHMGVRELLFRSEGEELSAVLSGTKIQYDKN